MTETSSVTSERKDKPGNSNSVLQVIGFREELAILINKHSIENSSDTPDFILSEYIMGCLRVYDQTVRARDKWYGQSADRIGGEVLPDSVKKEFITLEQIDAVLANEQQYSRESIVIVLARTLNQFVLVQAELAILKRTKGVSDED